MAIIKKFSEVLPQPLSTYQTFIVDTNPNSTYFRITELKDTFTGGKNGFLIEGSEHLKESTEIRLQILDVNGDPIYFEPGNGVPEYYEGTSKLIAVYIYEDTPIGIGKITILGELKTYVDADGFTQNIPTEWQSVYNVKWEKEVKVNKLLSNEDKVRFYRRPVVNIDEIVKPIFNNVTATIVQTGSLNGLAQAPQLGQTLTNYTAPTSYLLSINDSTNWTGSVLNTYIEVPSLGYRTLAESVINNKQLLVQTPYTINGIVAGFDNEGYTASFNYVENANNLKTALTGSFAKIRIGDLTTFVGDVARVKIFRKSQSDLADYQFVQEIRLESNEILRDLESQIKNEEFYGIFDNVNYKNYWITSSNNLVTTFNQNYLFNSIELDSSGVNNFYTSKSLDITEGIEYVLSLNVRVGQVTTDNYIKAYLSGSRQTSVNGSPKTIQINQNIVTITSDNSLLQKSQLTTNFKAEEINDARLYFEVKGNDWYIADVGLRASQETSFSPDEITFIQSVPRTLPEETFLYRFEFYDINNNYIPVLVEATKTFNGGNLQKIQKGLVFNPRSLQFQFDSGSNPVPPTVVGFTVAKNLLTGSVHYSSQSFDFDGNELFSSSYIGYVNNGGGFPGLLDGLNTDAPTMTVQHFTGSRTDKTVQIVKITGECEGYYDTVIFSRVLDGFGGVNHIIRPFRGTQIRNSSTSSLEIQAVRIDGVNDIQLSSLTKPEKGWPDKQLHILSRSLEGNEKFVNLAFASSSGYIKGLNTGSIGTGEINYNATFNRDSIDFRRTIYLMSSQSAASGPAYSTSGSVNFSIILEDLQDGLDTGVVTYTSDTFTINPRTEALFRPEYTGATASFITRTADNVVVTASFQVFPSMSINNDWIPEYWMYYTTQSVNSTISVIAKDENGLTIPSRPVASYISSPLQQSKNLTFTFTYTEPWTSASVSFDKTFTIVPEGKTGDESIVFELVPSTVTLPATARGVVKDYSPAITDIKLKQGSRYLSFSSSVSQNPIKSHGQFHIAQNSIIGTNITPGNVYFDVNYTSSLIISASSNLTQLSGSITYPLIIHPYYTSSVYTASITQQYTKVLDSPDQIEIIINPSTTTLNADEVGYITPAGYVGANTTIRVKEGGDFLTFTTQSSVPGTWRFGSIETRNATSGVWNIRTGSLSSSSLDTATLNFNRFDYPHVSASVTYNVIVYPYSLGPGHLYTSSVFQRTQTITKNVPPPAARSVDFKASSYSINYDRDGVQTEPEGDITLTATAFNTTGSVWFRWYYIDYDGNEVPYGGPDPETSPGLKEASISVGGGDAAGPGEIKTWKVKIWDGDPDGGSPIAAGNKPVRAEGQLTVSGIKGGADAYKLVASNENSSITADLWTTSFTGTAIKITTFKGVDQLVNVPYYNPLNNVYNYLGDFIGILGFSSASIYSKSPWITLAANKFPATDPAQLADITGWTTPGVNKSGEIVYKIEYEGESSGSFSSRQTHFVTQSISVQFTEPAPYLVESTNSNASIQAELWTTNLAGSGNTIRAFRGTDELANINPLPATDTDNYGTSGLSKDKSRVTIHSKSGHITLAGGLTAGSFVSGTPATIGNLTGWTSPGVNTSAEVVYKIECEGRETIYKTQSLSAQITPPAPYSINLSNENSAVIYRVSGEIEFDLTSTVIRAYRGDLELTNVSTFTGAQTDMYGVTGYPNQCRVSILAYSAHIVLAGGLTAGSHITGTPATTPIIADWLNPEANPVGEIIFQIDCEGRETIYKTQSISVNYEGNTGPGIVMRGIWSSTLDYISDTASTRRDAVIWPDPATVNKETHYWAAITGSGPGTPVGAQQPDGSSPYNDTTYWQYLGQEEFFVSAKIAIFEESYVKNTLNVGTKDGTGAFANIVLAGGRTDPYIAIGQTGTQGSAGTGVTVSGPGVIGYNRPGIFMGVYEDGANGTTGRFSIKTTGTSGKGMFWDGDVLTVVGSIRQREPGIPEGSFRGAWTSGTTYYPDDTVTYSGASYINSITHTSTNNTNINTGYPPNATNSWTVYAAAGTSGTAGTSGASGTNGSPGAGVVFRGNFATGNVYYHSTERRDIVRAGSTFYLVNNTSLNNNSGSVWGTPPNANWTSFGAQFSSVATDVLLAQDATITRGLVMGTEGSNTGFIRSAGASSLLGGTGFYLDVQGRMRFGEEVSGSNNYVYWDGTDLNINGTINAQAGNIGGFTIANNQLIASASLLRIDTQIPQIEFYTNATGSAKVVLNPKPGLTDPSGQTLYVTESKYDGTDGNRTAISGTSVVDAYIIETYSGSMGTTAVYGSPTYTPTAFTEGGITNFEVYIPQTSLTLTGTSPTANSSYPPYSPNYQYESYYSEYAQGASAVAQWYLQMFNSAGTTLISEVSITGAYVQRTLSATNNYYQATGMYPGPYSWSPASYTSTAYYSGDIIQATKAGQINIPSAGTYKFRLVLKISVNSAVKYDYDTGINTYYSATATSNHTRTGYVYDAGTLAGTFSFSPNLNKTEITNGGIQILSNKDAYVQFYRIEPSAYGSSETLARFIGAKVVMNAYGGYPSYFNNTALDVNGIFSVSSKSGNVIGITDYDTGTPGYVSLTLGGRYSATVLSEQTKVSIIGNFYPYLDDKYDLGGSSYRWRDIFTNGPVTTTSDETKKIDIQPASLGLDFINRLQPKSYRMLSGSVVYQSDWPNFIDEEIPIGERDETGNIVTEVKYKKVPNPEPPPIVDVVPGKRTHYGLLAQDVKQTLDEMGLTTTDFAGYVAGDIENNTELGLRYDEFISPMIKAIQELSQKVSTLEAQISGSIL